MFSSYIALIITPQTINITEGEIYDFPPPSMESYTYEDYQRATMIMTENDMAFCHLVLRSAPDYSMEIRPSIHMEHRVFLQYPNIKVMLNYHIMEGALRRYGDYVDVRKPSYSLHIMCIGMMEGQLAYNMCFHTEMDDNSLAPLPIQRREVIDLTNDDSDTESEYEESISLGEYDTDEDDCEDCLPNDPCPIHRH